MPTNNPKTLLVHICCSVDSHHFLSELRKILPETQFIGYFYNPNIHPEEEYELRLFDVRRSCRILKIPLIEESYDPSQWLKESLGLEHYPEKGKRCSFCFDFRLEKSAQKAHECKCDALTTTLLASPMKSTAQLFQQGKEIEKRFDIRFFLFDPRSNGGTTRQQKLAKDTQLYRQNYCGCLYALDAQREKAKKQTAELFSSISRKRENEDGLFAKRREELQRRDALERAHKDYFWGKEKQLLWHNLYTRLLDSRGESIPIHILALSTYKGKISLVCEREIGGIFYFDKNGARAITLARFCALTQRAYSTINELIYSPPSIHEETLLRIKLGDSALGTSPIFVLEHPPYLEESYRLFINAFMQEEIIQRAWEV